MPQRPTLNPWWLAPLAVICVAALTFWQRSQVPERDHWRAATEHIAAHLQPGDGVTWVPYHAGEGRVFFHTLPAFHLPEPEAADLSRYDRVWLLGAFGEDADSLRHRPLAPEGPLASAASSGHTVVETHTFGPLTLQLLEISGPKVTVDLRVDLDKARVERHGRACDFWSGDGWHCIVRKAPDAVRACLGQPLAARARMKPRRRHQHHHMVDHTLKDCGLDPWLHVSRDAHVIGDWPRRCVWMHPTKASPTRLVWPHAVSGDTVVVDYGFVDKIVHDNYSRDVYRPAPKGQPDAPREKWTRPVTLRVLQGEAVISEISAPPEKGWRRLAAKITPDGGPVTVEVSSADHRNAYFCADVTVRGPR